MDYGTGAAGSVGRRREAVAGRPLGRVHTDPPNHRAREERIQYASLAGIGRWIAAVRANPRREVEFEPSFSPNVAWVYFTSSRTGKNQVWRIAVDGGEAEQITEMKDGVASYVLSPNGQQIAFTAHETDPAIETARKEKRDVVVVDENPPNAALYLIPAETSAQKKRAHRKIASGDYHVGGGPNSIAWSPDSRSIAFTHFKRPEAEYQMTADISEVEVASGVVKPLAATGVMESAPLYSPDGRWIAFQRSSNPPRWAIDGRIVLLPRAGGAPRELAATFDEWPLLVGWDAASQNILFIEARGTRGVLYSMPLSGSPAVLFAPQQGTLTAVSLNAAGTHVAYLRSSPSEAPEVYAMSLAARTPVQVSRANTALPKLDFPKTELVRWKSRDGLEVEGLLTYPAGHETGKRYPLLLNIHGGPAGGFLETFIGGPDIHPLATLAGKGYAILRPNPRGSSGYGRKFRFANENDWGGGDYEDVMAGVDAVIAKGVADPERLGVMGWSYGGFMTSWIIGHTTRFKAAVAGAAITNLRSFTGTADVQSYLADYFKGEPWRVFESYRAHSPMTYAGKFKTPTLILHGRDDLRVPIGQGYELYNALKRQGVPAKMVTYPRMPHVPTEPKFMLDIMDRQVAWMDQYVKQQK
ncbi:MAG: S9 family peptidase [Bryobacterales bacterium]|nr:S9 family peptidase [Bryobacterales bacterium]